MVRNKLIQTVSESFDSKTARWFHNRLIDRKINNSEEWYNSSISEQMKMIDPAIITRIQQLVQADPYLSFRKPAVCQKWLSNECIHGESCFYAHELPLPGEHSPNMEKFGIRGRYLGTVDPNGTAIIEKLQAMRKERDQFESKYNIAKQRYTNAVAEYETECMQLDEQTKKLMIELHQYQSKYHSLLALISIQERLLKRAEDEKKSQ